MRRRHVFDRSRLAVPRETGFRRQRFHSHIVQPPSSHNCIWGSRSQPTDHQHDTSVTGWRRYLLAVAFADRSFAAGTLDAMGRDGRRTWRDEIDGKGRHGWESVSERTMESEEKSLLVMKGTFRVVLLSSAIRPSQSNREYCNLISLPELLVVPLRIRHL